MRQIKETLLLIAQGCALVLFIISGIEMILSLRISDTPEFISRMILMIAMLWASAFVFCFLEKKEIRK